MMKDILLTFNYSIFIYLIIVLNNKHKLLFKENNINIESKIKDNHEIDDNKNNYYSQ